jgi:glycosyltransferase involved in cell wall biosynthesis
MSSNRKILFFPHFNKVGGAGLYICNLIDILSERYAVECIGRYSYDYGRSILDCVFFRVLNFILVPLYDGVRLPVAIFFFIRSFFIVFTFSPGFFFLKRKIREVDCLVLTSSIQFPLVFVFRLFFPKIKLVILIQENALLDYSFLLGRLMCLALKKADIVISITDQWASQAQAFNISSTVIRNFFDIKTSSCEKKESTLLYVGGDAWIKGFDFLLRGFELISYKRKTKLIMLGSYGDKATKKIQQVAARCVERGSVICVEGLKSEIDSYYQGTDLVVIPIAKPHFCRPAIEAGFFNKTFLVSDFKELSDFCRPDQNCVVFDRGNVDDFVSRLHSLLSDKDRLVKLGLNNNAFVSGRFTRQIVSREVLNCFSRIA